MIPIEQYAELCALMGATGGDANQENAIAANHGVSPEQWAASKAGWTARMSDPNDGGRTALAFMPLYSAAQARMRGGGPPCTLEFYAKVHAEMTLLKDPMGNKLNHHLVLAQNGTHHQAWLECESYWTPLVAGKEILGQPNPKFDPDLGDRFHVLLFAESDRITGFKPDRGGG